MSKKVKMALGVAAAIAIPYYAPNILGTIAPSLAKAGGMSAVLGSAGIGALGGALGANLQGGDWRTGATLGAIGGGIAGYNYTPTGGADAAQAAASTPATPSAPTLPTSVTDTSGFLMQPTTAGIPSSPMPGLGGTTVPTSPLPGLGGAGFSGPSAASSPGLLSGVGEALGGPSVYVPAGIQLGAAYLGQQQAAEAQAQADKYMAQQAAEVERQRQLENNLFAQQQALAQSLKEQAEATNPEYFATQSAARARQAGALATREAEQAVPFYKPGLQRAERRRGQLATAANVGTAYDVGYGTGVEQKTRLTQAAIESLGSAPRTEGYATLANYYGGQAADAMRGGLDVGRLFGDITGRYEQEQNRRREEERLNRIEAAANRGVIA